MIYGIDVENPFEYYDTKDIDEIPDHLKKEAKKYGYAYVNP